MSFKRPVKPMLAVLIVFSAAITTAANSAFPEKNWLEVTPESQGIDPAKLKAAVDYMEKSFGPDGAKELVIVRNGYLIWQGTNADAYHPVWSCTKTFTSAVLGLLVDDGKCALDTRTIEYLPSLADANHLYSKIKLRHLASMTGGYRGEVKDVGPERPWGEPMAFLNPRQPLFEPGTTIQYNDHDVFLLGKILTLVAQEPLSAVFKRRIADPIGMTKWEWAVSGTVEGIDLNNPPGNPGGQGAGGVHTTAREMARFGLLFLNRGNWNGMQLLSASFIEKATTNQVPASYGYRNHDFRGRYGFYWWTNGVMPALSGAEGANGKRPWPSAPAKTYTSHGRSANFCFVIPEWNMVIVRMGTSPISKNIAKGEQLWNEFFSRLKQALRVDGDAAPHNSEKIEPDKCE
jgi:CubicO group peptidase (beta-lactamase class C family)